MCRDLRTNRQDDLYIQFNFVSGCVGTQWSTKSMVQGGEFTETLDLTHGTQVGQTGAKLSPSRFFIHFFGTCGFFYFVV